MMVKRHENLRQVQQAVLKDMLQLETSPWKVLVLDAPAQKLMSPVLRVADLRDCGVTLHLQLHASRAAVPDVPAVYFCEPTAGNVQRIAADINAGLFASFHLHFTSSLPRQLMEELVQTVLPNAHKVHRIYDQYMTFECIESKLFVVDSQPALFGALMSSASSDAMIDELLDRQAFGLLSVMVTVGGQLPVIAAQRSSVAAESVAAKLDVKLRNLMQSTKAKTLGGSALLSSDDLGLQRPLVIVLDRAMDIAAPLKHAACYAALINDVFGMQHNRCSYTDEKGDRKTFSVDPGDDLWAANAHRPFPDVTDAVDEALKKYKHEHDAITGKQQQAEDLRLAIEVLPELNERKRQIDQHLMLCQSLLNAIKDRQLGEYYSIEQRLDRATCCILLNDRQSLGRAEDKFRLFLLYLLLKCAKAEEQQQWERDCSSFLNHLGPELKQKWANIKKYIDFNRQTLAMASGPASPATSPTAQGPPEDSMFLGRLTKAGGGLLSGLAAGMKTLVGESTAPAIVKTVDLIYDQLTGSAAAGSPHAASKLTIFDPKLPRSEHNSPQPVGRGKSAFSHLVVFVVGGVSRCEYDSLLASLSSARYPTSMVVSVGGSELVNADSILNAFE